MSGTTLLKSGLHFFCITFMFYPAYAAKCVKMCNLNFSKQIARIILGLALITLAWFGPQTSLLDDNWIHLWKLGWTGLIPLLTGITAFCPVYAVLGFGPGHGHGHGQKS